MILYCDLETFSATPIKCGPHRYAEDPQARILLWGYAIDDAPAKVWDVDNEPMPMDLANAIATVKLDSNSRHVWHNGINFDTVFIERVAPEFSMPLARIADTMLIAYEHGLPGSLMDLSTVYGLSPDKAKDRDGKRLIRLFCAPREDGTFGKADHPEDWQKFINYCRLDIEAMREIYKRLPKWNCTDEERRLMLLDAKINRRGMYMDVDLAKKAVEVTEANAEALRKRTWELTDGTIESATRTQATLKFIKDKWGIELKNLTKGEVERLLQQEDLPEPMKELLRVRVSAAKASIKKFQVVLDSVNSDNRLRGCLQFRGAARTGRFSGRLFQPQNLPRPKLKKKQVALAVDAVKGGYVDLMFDDIGSAVADTLRGAITVPTGKKLVVADYSNIEGRVLAWLAGEEWKLQAFRDYDNKAGHDLYKLTYARSFNVDPDTVTDDQRQIGKVLELAMGYGGGVGAFAAFATGYGINLSDMAERVANTLPRWAWDQSEFAFQRLVDEGNKARMCGLDRRTWVVCDSLKRLWRNANSKIVDLWGRLDEACLMSLTEGVRVTVAGTHGVKVAMRSGWLLIRLPSGRILCYPQVERGDETCSFSYMGVHQMSRKWTRIKTFAGKITENITQAVACDVLTNALVNLEEEGFDVILSVHDEVLTEAPDDEAHSYQALKQAMELNPEWAKGLPLAAAGFSATRYRK